MLERMITVRAMAACLLLALGSGCFATSEEPSLWSRWSALELRVRDSALFRGRIEMRLTDAPDGRRLETSTVASFIGVTVARTTTTTTFDAATGRTKEYSSYSKKRGRRYSFGENGYKVEKLLPSEDGGWEVAYASEYDNPAAAPDGEAVQVFDYYGMLLHLRKSPLDKLGDEITLHVATSRGPEAYRIRVTDSREGRREITDLTTGETTSLPARELRLTVSPVDPEAEAGFLKMKGETEIWVEAESKTPLEIGGKVPRAGRIRLVLTGLG